MYIRFLVWKFDPKLSRKKDYVKFNLIESFRQTVKFLSGFA